MNAEISRSIYVENNYCLHVYTKKIMKNLHLNYNSKIMILNKITNNKSNFPDHIWF